MMAWHTSSFALLGVCLPAALAAVPLQAATFSTLYTFTGGNGAQPTGGLVEHDGVLYGSVPNGGLHGLGLVFSITPAGNYSVLQYFNAPAGGGPSSSLVVLGKNLYGTGRDGTADSSGSVIRVPLRGGKGTGVLYGFGGAAGDGTFPEGGVTKVGQLLYGTTSTGGASGLGTIFSITPSGQETVIYSFRGGSSDGANPEGGLINVGGVLYGTTSRGGNGECREKEGCGTVFSVTTSGTESVLHAFRKHVDGETPLYSLTRVGAKLYGTTSSGGVANCPGRTGCGTIFSIKPDGSGFHIIHSFQGTDGSSPLTLLNVAGTLYGTCGGGGSASGGTIFQLDPQSGAVSTLYNFSGDEAYPSSGVLYYGGTFYGETNGTGESTQGILYAFTP